jgi:hypothetical protein
MYYDNTDGYPLLRTFGSALVQGTAALRIACGYPDEEDHGHGVLCLTVRITNQRIDDLQTNKYLAISDK